MTESNQSKVDLLVNGKQAETELQKLRDRVVELRKNLEDAFKKGSKEQQAYFQKELKGTQAELRKMESGVHAVERTMKQLNSATPKDLRKALNYLQADLKTIERGSSAWNEHVAKIKMVKAELDKINAEMKQSESLMVRMKNKLNDWGTMIAGGAAALTGVVMAGKKAVQSYAEMEQEMANVRKYTGMTAEQVEHLNEAFKKMDTRTSREGLNQLAQEAGRLGMQSEEDVLGFVRAADKINVALDDLGEGATLTLSKLTDIFGDRERLGTEQSLLAVGSVINELSQNCTASAPYLAEFAQRLAGVGAQAGMSVPEIMGFGAVLDSQGQKLEMSATALSKVIMNLFKNPEKIANATGMAVEQFSETCKRSTNEGLMMLLDRLHELGGIDTLAPVFADMGENGARASAVLAALAGNVDMVRQQQEAANVAFSEAVSIDKEFNVQNETVQAGLEKARKRFNEMAVELGQKLLPVMGYFLSSTSMTMKALRIIVDWVIKYKGAIVTLGAAVAAYTVVANLLIIKEKAHAALIAVKTAALHVHKVAVLLASAAYGNLTNNTIKANAAMKLLKTTMSASPWGLLFAGITAAVGALAVFVKKHNELNLTQKTMADAQKEINRQYTEQKSKIYLLNDTLHDEKLSLEARKKALNELKSIVPDYHASLTDEGKLINDNADAVYNYTAALEKQIQLQVYQEKLMELYQKKMQAEENLENSETALTKAQQEASEHSGEVQMRTSMGAAGPTGGYENSYSVNVRVKTENLEGAKKELSSIEDAITKIKGKIDDGGLLEAPTKTNTVTPESGAPTGGGEEQELKDKLKELADIRKTIMAQDKIAYLQGVTNYEQYQQSQLETEIAYQKKVMAVHGEGTTGYLEAEAAMLEAQKKLKEHAAGQTIEAEQKSYSDLKAVIDQNYADGKMSAKTYQLALEAAELDHLKAMVELYDEGSEERLKAQEKYQARSLQYQQKHAADAKRIQERLQKDYFSNVGMTTNTESYEEEKLQLEAVRQIMMAQATAEQKLQIEEAYQKAKYELAKKYNDEAGMMAVDAAQASVDQVLEYMKTDGFQGFYQSFSTLVSGMGEIFSGLSSLIDAEVSQQEAQINKKYDAEIKAAGKNEKEVARLEAKKEKEIAAVKNEAEEKKYAMQIASTIAQTAISAVNAYSSAAAIPIVGWVMGPIAAAMAVAAGGIQLATLKKQHDTAMAQGYAAGGYTMPGSKYQPAGIVHAGEWVASQELLANPTAAATIAQLDQAQRTNTIGQLDRQQVSASVSAPVAAARSIPSATSSEQSVGMKDALDRLNKRLDEPFVNVNTVTGDKGTLRAQKRYEQLMRNKSKK